MKKLFALTLALMMALTCMSAFADTVDIKLTVDPEVTSGVLTGFGMSEEDVANVNPILSVVNSLGTKVTTVDDGAQIDLDLNGKAALSLGFAQDDTGAKIASTLFPNYLLTLSNETISQLMEQFAANMSGASSEGGAAGFDPNALAETFGGYFQTWMEACSAAGQPGDPVTGEYEFEGYKFDTMVPVTVDMAKITEATQTLLDSLLADPAAMGMLKTMAQSAAKNSGADFDEENFEAQFKEGFEEFMAHFPATANVEFYTNSDSEGTPFYMYGEALREGETDPFTCYMLYVDDTNMFMGYQDGETSNASFQIDGNTMGVTFEMGEVFFGLAFSYDETQFACDLYFMNQEKPIASLVITSAEGGERTVSMDEAGKTVVTVESIMSGEGEGVEGLAGDIMSNGLGTLMGTLEEVPELSGLLGLFMGGGEAMAG